MGCDTIKEIKKEIRGKYQDCMDLYKLKDGVSPVFNKMDLMIIVDIINRGLAQIEEVKCKKEMEELKKTMDKSLKYPNVNSLVSDEKFYREWCREIMRLLDELEKCLCK